MVKVFFLLFLMVLGYFAFNKRTTLPKEIRVTEDVADIETLKIEVKPTVSNTAKNISVETVSSPTKNSSVDMIETIQSVSATTEIENEILPEVDEPKENVDQTIIANEKRLASAKSASEVFELLQKLRIRIKKLGETSVVADKENYSKFLGSYEGPVLNRRQESVYNLKLEIKQNPDPKMPTVYGRFLLDKAKNGKVTGELNGDFGAQLVGRDGLVISDALDKNYFQLYKLDNGYIAGTYYEKRKASYRAYKFILKNK